MTQFKAIGYHATNKADGILKEGINFQLPKNDVFLGRGFYLWRDSYSRATSWKKKEYKEDLEVLEVELNCAKDEMLNFTSIKWNKELDIIKLYIKYFKHKNIYFGELTFSHGSGTEVFFPNKWDNIYGEKVNLEYRI